MIAELSKGRVNLLPAVYLAAPLPLFFGTRRFDAGKKKKTLRRMNVAQADFVHSAPTRGCRTWGTLGDQLPSFTPEESCVIFFR